MKLIGSKNSPYVRKVRIYLAETDRGLAFEEIDVWAEGGEELLALNPIGKIPTLICEDGEVLGDSIAIVDYLDKLLAPQQRLVPCEPDMFLHIRRKQVVAMGLLDATVERTLEVWRPEGARSTKVIDRREARIAKMMAHEEARLPAQHSPQNSPQHLVQNSISHETETDWLCDGWLCHGAFSVADIDLAVALQYIDFRYPHSWREAFPKLASWASKIMARPSFEATLPDGFTPVIAS